LGAREAFLQRREGQPLGMFSRERSGGTMEVWGLGLYGVVNKI
jgi:hypothetical protein